MLRSNELIAFCWLIFVVVWLVSALHVKKTVKKGYWWKKAGFRLACIVIVLFVLQNEFFKQTLRHIDKNSMFQSPYLSNIGVLLCVGGIAFAIWARIFLGRNWGQPMTIREKPDLIMSGPYKYVRHPIYTGISMALFGSILATSSLLSESILWLVVFIGTLIYFVYSAKTEEKNMTKEFPKEYPLYVEKSKMFLPFLY